MMLTKRKQIESYCSKPFSDISEQLFPFISSSFWYNMIQRWQQIVLSDTDVSVPWWYDIDRYWFSYYPRLHKLPVGLITWLNETKVTCMYGWQTTVHQPERA